MEALVIKDSRSVVAEAGLATWLFARYCGASENVRLSANRPRSAIG